MIRRLLKERKGVRAITLLGTFLLIALSADFLANERALVAIYKGQVYFPVLRAYLVEAGLSDKNPEPWKSPGKTSSPEAIVHPPIPYSPSGTDPRTSGSVSPFETQNVPSLHERHWLGTDMLGRDLLAGLIHGTRNALLLGIGATLIATVLGVLFGSLAGYFGDHRFRIRLADLLPAIPLLFLGIFYTFYTRGYRLSEAWADPSKNFIVQVLVSMGILGAAILLARAMAIPLHRFPPLRKRIRVPLDQIIMRTVDVLLSIPALFLILGILAVFEGSSLFLLILIIGMLGWCNMARLTRAEFLRIRELPYIEAVRAIGASEFRIIRDHAIPNALSPILIAASYGVAGSILTGSALSFLGLTPGDLTFWGGILANARDQINAWWLVVFPGLAIFLLVQGFHRLGECLQNDERAQRSDRKSRCRP